MSTPPLVSIVIPCFNCAKTLDETLASLVAQTEQRFEIICVDDASNDATPDRLAAWALQDSRIRIIRQANAGCGAARNTGIGAAQGRFIGLIDADDLWAPTYLARHLAAFDADPTLGVSFTRIHFIANDGSPTGETTRPKLTGLTPQDILEQNPAGCAMMVARREVFDEVGVFDKRLRRAEDQEWLFRVSMSRWRVAGIDDVLADYRNSPAGLSANLDAQLGAYVALLGHVAEYAPDIVARGRRRAIASMQLFCARRALRLGLEAAVIRNFLAKALIGAPELVYRQPRAVAGLLVAAVSPKSAARLLATSRRPARA